MIRGIVRFGRPLYRGWMAFARAVGRVNTHILLGVFFFGVITPVAVVSRLFGKDLLSQRLEPEAPTYWKAREPKAFDPRDYQRQF